MSEPINNGELLLPVCIPESEITHLFGALDLYRVMKNEGKSYPAFDAVVASVEFIDNPQDSPCLDIDTGSNTCWSVDATSRAIRFFPNDPFNPEDERQTVGQWERWEYLVPRPQNWIGNLLDLAESQTDFDRNIGYFPNDCMVVAPDETGDALEDFFGTINAIRSLQFPYIELEVIGTGELELHLLNMPFGGSVIVVWDIEFDVYAYLWDLVNGGAIPPLNMIQTELEREITSFPPESQEENVIEIQLDTDGTHIIRAYFVPRVDYTAIDVVGVGGGIREVSACGNLSLVSDDGTIITKQNSRIAEFTRRNYIMATQQDICEAIMCAFEKSAQRFLLASDVANIENSISIDKTTGDISLDKSSTSGGVPDDVTSTRDEAINGGVSAVANGFAKMLSDMDEYFDNSIVDTVTQYYFEQLYDIEDTDALLSAIQQYFSYRTTPHTALDMDTASLAESLFCGGVERTTLNRWAIFEAPATLDDMFIKLFSCVAQSQIDSWFDGGYQQPRNDYLNYVCSLRPSLEITYTASNLANDEAPTIPVAWNISSRRLVRVQITGQITGSNGEIIDGVFHKAENGDLTKIAWAGFNFTTPFGLASAPDNTTFNSSGGYEYTVELDAIGTGFIIYFTVPNQAWQDTATGEFTVRIIDLGSV